MESFLLFSCPKGLLVLRDQGVYRVAPVLQVLMDNVERGDSLVLLVCKAHKIFSCN